MKKHQPAVPADSYVVTRSSLQQALASCLDFTAPLKQQCDDFDDLARAVMTELAPTAPPPPPLPSVRQLKARQGPAKISEGTAAVMGFAVLIAICTMTWLMFLKG